MKIQALFSLKDKSKKIRISSAAIFGALRVKYRVAAVNCLPVPNHSTEYYLLDPCDQWAHFELVSRELLTLVLWAGQRCNSTLLYVNTQSKTESATFISRMRSLLPGDLPIGDNGNPRNDVIGRSRG